MPSYRSPGVYVEEVSSGSKPIQGVGTAVAAFVGLAERGPVHEPTLVTNWTQFTSTFGGFLPEGYLAHAVYGYFLNGGGSAYVVRIGSDPAATAPVVARAVLPAAGGEGVAVEAAEGAADQPVSVEVVAGGEADETFKVVVRAGEAMEEFDGLTHKRGPQQLATALRRSKLVKVDEVAARAIDGPLTAGTVTLQAATPTPTAPASAEDYIGDAGARTGFAGLEAVDEVTMLSVPDAAWAHERGLLDADGLKAVHLAMIAHCELMGDRMAIIDAPIGLNAQGALRWRVHEAGYDSAYAALYWPWVKVMDPSSGRPALVPPSGHVAGVWARSDDTRGVHKAPANEVVRGVLDPEVSVTRGEQDQLNPVGLNCIRAFPGRGVRIWGARTASSDPEWRYLNVRRLFNFVEKSILLGTDWVVFEPNDEKLWDSVNRTVTMFLRTVWRTGALFGTTPADAFYVKCDAENNPAESRDVGQLVVDIGIAPVRPAEFVVIRISQLAAEA